MYCSPVGVGKKIRAEMALFFVILVMSAGVIGFGSVPRVYAHGGGDFGFGISQPKLVGCTATYTITFLPYGEFTGLVAESALGVPIAKFSMGLFFLSTVTVDELHVLGLSPGTTYNLTVVAYAAGLAHYASTMLTTPPQTDSNSCSNGTVQTGGPAPDFNMVLTPTATPLYAVGTPSISYVLTYKSINGFTGLLHERVMNVPGVFVSFFSSGRDPASGSCQVEFSCSDVVTIYTGSLPNGMLPTGTYPITITAYATGGTPYHSMTINLTVPSSV